MDLDFIDTYIIVGIKCLWNRDTEACKPVANEMIDYHDFQFAVKWHSDFGLHEIIE